MSLDEHSKANQDDNPPAEAIGAGGSDDSLGPNAPNGSGNPSEFGESGGSGGSGGPGGAGVSNSKPSLMTIATIVLLISLMTPLAIIVYKRKRGPSAFDRPNPDKELIAQVIKDPDALDPLVVRQLPDFTLTDQRDQNYGSSDLRGKVWIADFIFTRCTGTCPAITMSMTRLQEKLRENPRWKEVRIVSLSVDPSYDTPAVLADYAKTWKADKKQWLFLTGPKAKVHELIKKSFLLPVIDAPANTKEPIIHSQRIVLVDRLGRHRGFYRAMDKKGHDGTRISNELDQLLEDLNKVLKEPIPKAKSRPASKSESESASEKLK
jgi:protein SCO1/2